jgi:hypothetical protein
MSKHIYQQGRDGLGHQLEGLFTCMIMHNVDNFYFDGVVFHDKKFVFQHVNSEKGKRLKNYLQAVINLFINDNTRTKIEYKSEIRSHEIWNIPQLFDPNILYSLDNNFFFERLYFKNSETKSLILSNIQKIKPLFINSLLPPNRLKTNSIVFHVRLGDAMPARGSLIRNYIKQFEKLLKKFQNVYPDYSYIIHSDGDVKNILQYFPAQTILFDKTTCVLDTLSDFIYADILVCGISSLSIVSSYLGNKQLVIVHDEIDRIPTIENVYKISHFLENEIV